MEQESVNQPNFCTILSSMEDMYKKVVEISDQLYVIKNKLNGVPSRAPIKEVVKDEDLPYISGIVPNQKILSDIGMSRS